MNLKHLKLSKNQITDEGVRLLCQTLLYSNVQTLDLSHNDLGAGSFDHLSILIRNNKRLKTINLKGNAIDSKTKQKIVAEFKYFGIAYEI